MANDFLSIDDVYLARKRISSIVRRTPLLDSPKLLEISGSNVLLKHENLQVTGAFKIRGAANKIINLSSEEQERGVITVSSGNHGKAVTYVANKIGAKSTICMSKVVPPNKCHRRSTIFMVEL